MDDWSGTAVQALSRSYLRDYPLDAAKRIEAMPPGEVAEALAEQPVDAIAPLFGALAPDVAASLLRLLPEPSARGLLESMSPNATLTLLRGLALREISVRQWLTVVPVVLKRLGQDPAQSSSIVLTTITDIAGFFSFLGIATVFMAML